jgi:hypothetical protein
MGAQSDGQRERGGSEQRDGDDDADVLGVESDAVR